MGSPRGLLVGCGGIGAMYDLTSDEVVTHARAYERLGIPFAVFDVDAARARSVAERYGCPWFTDVEEIDFDAYDVVSICSPTPTHVDYLARLLEVGTPLIFCEKPVASSIETLDSLGLLFTRSRSNVVVNYMRRFQPAYANLREELMKLRTANGPDNIIIRYQRGFLNNASHAFDLLEFLFGEAIAFEKVFWARMDSDGWGNDPTLSGVFSWSSTPVFLVGFASVTYPVFEIEIAFPDQSVHIADRGDVIRRFRKMSATDTALTLDSAASQSNCIRDYMLPVFEYGLDLTSGGMGRGRGNFEEALRLNRAMLQVIDGLG